MHIIKAEENHFDIVRELFREYQSNVSEDGSSECFQGFEEELASLPGFYDSPHGIIYLAFNSSFSNNDASSKSKENVVGCVAIKPRSNNPKHAEIKRLFVRQLHRSSGAGKKLIAKSMQFAQDNNYEAMFLETVASMQAAIGLYERIGFKPIDRSQQSEDSAVKLYQYDFNKKR